MLVDASYKEDLEPSTTDDKDKRETGEEAVKEDEIGEEEWNEENYRIRQEEAKEPDMMCIFKGGKRHHIVHKEEFLISMRHVSSKGVIIIMGSSEQVTDVRWRTGFQIDGNMQIQALTGKLIATESGKISEESVSANLR